MEYSEQSYSVIPAVWEHADDMIQDLVIQYRLIPQSNQGLTPRGGMIDRYEATTLVFCLSGFWKEAFV